MGAAIERNQEEKTTKKKATAGWPDSVGVCFFPRLSLSLSLSLSTFSSSAIPSSFGPSFGLPARCCWSLLLLVPLTAATDKAKASHGQTNDDAMAGRTPTADRWRLDRETTTTLAARHTRTRKWRTRENGGAATLTGRVGGGDRVLREPSFVDDRCRDEVHAQ